jgi:hypothetical protein
VDVQSPKPGFTTWASFESRSQRRDRAAHEDDFIVENHRIEATLNTALELTAVTRVTLRPNERIVGALPFEISPQIQITSALLDGKALEVFRRESFRESLMRGGMNETFLVTLPEPLEAGKAYELEFRHQGTAVRDAGNGVYFVAARSNWYPTHGAPFSLYDLTFRVPKDLDIVATGALLDERIEGDWRISHRRTSGLARFAGFNLGTYTKATVTRGPYQVDVFANRKAEPALQARQENVVVIPPPLIQRGILRRPGDIVGIPPAPQPDPTSRLNPLALEIASALEWMASVFGPPALPNLTVSPIPGSFGQGFPGLIYLSTTAFLPPEQRPASSRAPAQQTFFSEILHAHETAHQWWGNLVISASYHDEWLMEALANYSALLVLEKKKGPHALETALDEARATLLRPLEPGKTTESAGPITWGARLGRAGYGEPWRSITYDKGSWIMHMLRRRMGDTAFFDMLRALCERYRYKPISTLEFRELAAEFSPKGLPDPTLENFFDNWIFGTGIPVLDLNCDHKTKAANTTLSCTLRQSGVPDEFAIDVPVEIRIAAAKPSVRWMRSSAEPVSFQMNLKSPPVKVELAPGRAVLAGKK